MAVRTEIAMGTLVTVEVPTSDREVDHAIERAFSWFREVESCCSRFDEESELRRVSVNIGVAVRVSPILYEVMQFACLIAETTGGAFDPTVGRRMEMRGFDRNYRTGDIANSGEPVDGVTWRDVELDPSARTILLGRPLTLDLGGIAKGFAVDLAARELAPFRNFAIDAGGDLYLGGLNSLGNPWRIGIPHPRIPGQLIAAVPASNRAVCTSADYERRRPDGEHHIIDPRTGDSPRRVASVTAIAPQTVLADALATAAFVLGPEAGIDLFENQNVEGLIVTADMSQFRTQSFSHAA